MGDNDHRMIINRKSLQGFCARIYESKTMDFSTSKIEGRNARIRCTTDSQSFGRTVEDHFTVDEIIVW